MSPQSLNRKAPPERPRHAVNVRTSPPDDGVSGDTAMPDRGLLVLLLTFAIATVGFLAGAAALLSIVPEPARQSVAATVLAMTGLTLAALAIVQTRASTRESGLSRRLADLAAENEALSDDIWHLKESDARHRDVLDTLGDVVTRWREGGDVVYANDAALKLFPDGRIDALHASGDDSGPAGCADIRIETATGPRWFARRDVAVRDGRSGEPLIQTILRDVTDRRQIEDALVAARNQAETASASKSRFLATVSHEIRTPLNGILGMAGLLRDTRLTAEQRSYVEAVRSSGEILLLLISEVLDMSKIEAGRLDLAPAPTDIALLAESVVELLSPRAQAKGLEIACFVSPRLPDRLVVDAVRLRQILFNLAGNGLKFTEEGGVEIALECEPAPADARSSRLAITVRDTGIGFSAGEAERLFEEFEQIDHGPARRFDGAGLGLSISRRLARLMGGEITATAAEGAGACFRVTLPLAPSADDKKADSAVGTGAALAEKTIVLVTRSRVEGPLVARRLEAEGAEALFVSAGDGDGDDALAGADLILLDPLAVSDAGAWLAGARAAGVTAPAIVMITPAERERLPRLRAAGFGAYLIRPIRSATLVQVVHAVLERGDTEAAWDLLGDDRSKDYQARSKSPASRPLRLLVADDNDINRMLTEALVRKLGHEPVVVSDGAEALDAVRCQAGFDMILMDLHMPGVDGLTAIRRFRDLERQATRTPVAVLAVTADVTPEAEEAALAAGADAVLTKPIDPELLARHLRDVGTGPG
ncbi:PAS domain-containing hybrid sensor histidine kinase/response regulator [Stappia stellulata]|uniref:PAS domain-containing hybrid sensor histidine kinase/response regulator n=1 Tax=Stappia stellulata TaxID=71235 RepID=UPI00042061FB|nr:PAS domain-containing hybrid sensor histidine kinase/response regulator [Stappia stellulata]